MINDLLNTLSHAPLSNLLILAGIAFWVLAIAGSLAGKITVEPGKQKTAGIVGTALIALGLVLLFVPVPVNQSAAERPTETTRTADSPTPTKKAESLTARTVPPPPEQKTEPVPAHHTRPNPSVNCTGTPDEVEICGSANLIDLDWQLHDLYQTAFNQSDKNQQSKLKQDENAWIKLRGECQHDEGCLIAAYKSRISQLQLSR
jgi:uncharacterized protein YecT (DUF1311 family)